MPEVHEINSIEELSRYEADWQTLLAQTRHPSFFQSLDWLTVYWKHFGEHQRLRVLVVCEHGSPIGILPLAVRRETTKAGPLRFLTYPLNSWGSFYGPIGPRPRETLTAALSFLRRNKRDWDVLELRWVHPEDVSRGDSAAALESCRLRTQFAVADQAAVIRLEGDFDAYFADRPSKWRNNYRRWERRLHERGAARYVRCRPRGEVHGDADPHWDLYDACVKIASRSWQAVANATPGTTLCHESISAFLRDTHAVAARRGAVDMNLLLLEEQPIAFAYNYQYRGYLYGLRVGYDLEAGKDGVGNLLYVHAIRDSFERGDHTYDLGPGSLDAKQYLLTSIFDIGRYSYYPAAAIRAQLVRLKRALASP